MGRGGNTDFGGSPQRRNEDAMSASDQQALRLLAIVADDFYSGLLPSGDYGDEEFDSGLLLSDDGQTTLGRAGEKIVSAAEADGSLAENVQAFRLLLAV